MKREEGLLADLDLMHAAATVKLPRRAGYDRLMARHKAEAAFCKLVLEEWPNVRAMLSPSGGGGETEDSWCIR